jgi:methane/ammonia monooxygenase subunit B
MTLVGHLVFRLRLALVAAALAAQAATGAFAHGERAQEPYLRTRTIQFYDVHFSAAKLAVNDALNITGKFRLMTDWPDAVAPPDVAFLATGNPGPVVSRLESYVDGVAARQSLNKLQLGRDYEFRIVLKGRLPGTYHIHPMVSIKGAGPLVGPGEWIEITGSAADFTYPMKTIAGVSIDNLETFGLGHALTWYAVWVGLAAFWLLYWIVRPLLLPRWLALQKGREDVLISMRDVGVGLALGVVVIGLTFGGYALTMSAYPYNVPLQSGTMKVPPLPEAASDIGIKVLDAQYDVPGRAMRVTAEVTNRGKDPVTLGEFTTANLRFVNQQLPPAVANVDASYPKELVARSGLRISDPAPIAPGETRQLKFEAADALWELERLTSFLTDVESRFGGLLFFFTPDGRREIVEVSGPIIPVFTKLAAK